MNPHDERFGPKSEKLFPRDFKNEDIPNTITYMRKSNNFMKSNCSSPFLKFSSTNSINFSVVAIGACDSQNVLFFQEEKEQAEVGQSPTLLAICAANGVLRILRGYFAAFLPAKKRKQDTRRYPV
ncbi:hypothetical protein ACFJIV_32985 [Mucilaginibacter sp. UC70_90]